MANYKPIPPKKPSLSIRELFAQNNWDWDLFGQMVSKSYGIASLRKFFRKPDGDKYSPTRMREIRAMYSQENGK